MLTAEQYGSFQEHIRTLGSKCRDYLGWSTLVLTDEDKGIYIKRAEGGFVVQPQSKDGELVYTVYSVTSKKVYFDLSITDTHTLVGFDPFDLDFNADDPSVDDYLSSNGTDVDLDSLCVQVQNVLNVMKEVGEIKDFYMTPAGNFSVRSNQDYCYIVDVLPLFSANGEIEPLCYVHAHFGADYTNDNVTPTHALPIIFGTYR